MRVSVIVGLMIGLCTCQVRPPKAPVSPDPAAAAVAVAPVWIDARFTPAEYVLILSAITDWNYVLNGYMALEPKPFRVDEPSQSYDAMDDRIWRPLTFSIDRNESDRLPEGITKQMLAWTYPRAREVHLIPDRMVKWDFQLIVEHEIGHILGADDYGDRSFMDGNVSVQPPCIDEVTLQHLAKLHNWSAAHMNSTCP